MNIEPENTPLEKENNLFKPSFSGSMLIFGGVSFFRVFFLPISLVVPENLAAQGTWMISPFAVKLGILRMPRVGFRKGEKLKEREGDHFKLGGGFRYFFSPLLEEDSHFD